MWLLSQLLQRVVYSRSTVDELRQRCICSALARYCRLLDKFQQVFAERKRRNLFGAFSVFRSSLSYPEPEGAKENSMTSVVKDILTPITKRVHGHDEGEGLLVPGQKVALILGVTGIVGKAMVDALLDPNTPGYPWKIYGVARRAKPSWLKVEALESRTGGSVRDEGDPTKPGASVFHYIQLNLLDREDTMEKLSKLKDVTHFMWMTWLLGGEQEQKNIDVNGRMYKNALDAVVRGEHGSLEHIVLQTGIKYYTGPFDLFGKVPLPDAPFKEEEPRRPAPNFYHNQEDMTLEAVKKTNGKVTWSEHRPSWIFGFAPRNLMNVLGTLAAYALICKHDNLPFVFPGNRFSWEHFTDASDARLIAEQEIWASLDPRAKNQAFNCSNGDVFVWNRMWRLLGKRFDLEVPEFKEEACFQDLMRDKGPTWDAIVKKYNLVPTNIEEVGHWWYADAITHLNFENVSSMNKSRKLGFLGWRDSEESMLVVLDEMKSNNLIP